MSTSSNGASASASTDAGASLSPMDDKQILATLGYKQEFKRKFSALELFGFSFSISAIAPSVASVLVYSLPYGGPWAVCSVFLVLIAIAIGELGSAAPTSGGLYYWTYKYSSKKYRKLLCWIVGYTNTITFVLKGVAGVNYACAAQIVAGASIGVDLAYVPTMYQIYGVYCAVLVFQAVVASAATRVLAKMQYVFIGLNVALFLAIIIALPAATPSEFMNSASYVFGHFENLSLWPKGFAFILSFLAPLWTVGGFDAGVHISEEALNANVAIPWAVVINTGVACTMGFALQICVAFCMGTDSIGILSNPVQQAMATILLEDSFGKRGMLALWSFIIVAQLMAGASLLTSSSRQIFAFSRDQALPFSRFLYRINRYTGTPVTCVCCSVSVAALLGLITFGGPAATGAIFSMGVVGQYVVDSIPIIARFMGPHTFEPGPFYLGAMSLPVSIAAVLWMWFMIVALLFPAEPGPVASTMNYSVVVFGGWILLSIMYYYTPKYGGVYWFDGPVNTVTVSVHGGSDIEERDAKVQ